MKHRLRVRLREFGHLVASRGRTVFATERERRIIRWIEQGFDKTLRLDYDLDDKAVVFDVGGYEGQWASDIFARYCCQIHVFEPSAQFADTIARRFARNPQIIVHDFGLAGTASDVAPLYIKGQGSSVFPDPSWAHRTPTRIETVRLMRAADFFLEWGMKDVDLMKINIEGGEYELLEHLIEAKLVVQIKNIQVQFHDFVPDAHKRMTAIQRELERTHTVTYQSEFVWENWARVDSPPGVDAAEPAKAPWEGSGDRSGDSAIVRRDEPRNHDMLEPAE
jgi:FkbM family methyltransferase